MAYGEWVYSDERGFQGVCLGCGEASEDAKVFIAVRRTGEGFRCVHPGCWDRAWDDTRHTLMAMRKVIADGYTRSGDGPGPVIPLLNTPLNKAAMQWVEIQNAKVLKRARAETQSMIDAMKASVLLEVCGVAREKVEEEMVRVKYRERLVDEIRKDVWSNCESKIDVAIEGISKHLRETTQTALKNFDQRVLRVMRDAFLRAHT